MKNQVNGQGAARESAPFHCRPGFMIMCLLLNDVASLAASVALAVLVKLFPHHLHSIPAYLNLAPLLLVFPVVYAGMGLYSGISLGSPEELRRLTLSSALIFLFLGLITVFVRGTNTLFTWTMALALVTSIVLVPLTRVIVRLKMGKIRWWGYPTIVFGDEEGVSAILNILLANPGLGLKPVGVHSSSDECAQDSSGVPVFNRAELIAWAESRQGPAYAVIALPFGKSESMMESFRPYFSHVLMIPECGGFSCVGVHPKNLGGMLALEIHQQVFIPSRVAIKRAMDFSLSLALCLVLLPLMALIALAVTLDSRGPVFYSQRRIGRGGHEFRAWKFRSMVGNADSVLADYLAEHPELREEWDLTHKLKEDPRVTPLGRLLRRTSLDELPQLWNVVTGEMSLVGPRPIVREEIVRYGNDFEIYSYVQSGLTGLWQVSGRSNTSYQQRVKFDRFYVVNWSVWLDLCILFRTIGAVISGSGAA